MKMKKEGGGKAGKLGGRERRMERNELGGGGSHVALSHDGGQ